MKRYSIGITVILILGMVVTGCNEREPEPEPLLPTSIPTTQVPSPEPSPTEKIILPTETSTPIPLPTATPRPMIPEDLALLSYRTLGQVEELASFSVPDVIDLEFSPDGRYLRMRVPTGEETHQDLFYDLEEGDEILNLEGGQRVYFNPDNTTITSLDNNTLATIKITNGTKTEEIITSHQAAALSPDGRQLVEIEVHDQEPPGTTLRRRRDVVGVFEWDI